MGFIISAAIRNHMNHRSHVQLCVPFNISLSSPLVKKDSPPDNSYSFIDTFLFYWIYQSILLIIRVYNKY